MPAEEDGAAEHEFLLTGLQHHSWYSVRVREIKADDHVGRWTLPVRGRTLPPPPQAPTIKTCNSTSSRQIVVMWEASAEVEPCQYSLHWISAEGASNSTMTDDLFEIRGRPFRCRKKPQEVKTIIRKRVDSRGHAEEARRR